MGLDFARGGSFRFSVWRGERRGGDKKLGNYRGMDQKHSGPEIMESKEERMLKFFSCL